MTGEKAGVTSVYLIITLIISNVFAIIRKTCESSYSKSLGFFVWFEVVSVAIFTLGYPIRRPPNTTSIWMASSMSCARTYYRAWGGVTP